MLAARALVPAGFMADVASGDFKLVMCSEVVRLASTKVVASSVTEQNPNQSDSHSDSVTHGPCSFASSATLVLASVNNLFFSRPQHDTFAVVESISSIHYRSTNTHAIRGPPIFS